MSAGEDEDVAIAMMRCDKCQRVVKSDGERVGGIAFCKHKYISLTTAAPTPQAADMTSNKSVSPGAKSRQRVMANLHEAAAIHQVTHNSHETQDWTEGFEKDITVLEATYAECQQTLGEEFEMLHKLLVERKQVLLNELTKNFDERYEKLDGQATQLKEHTKKAEDCKENCFQTIEELSKREELKERQQKVKNACKECIESKPTVYEVPIDLKWSFAAQRDVLSKLTKYGRLMSTRYDSGRKKAWTQPDLDVSSISGGNIPANNNSSNNNNSNNYNNNNNNNNNNNTNNRSNGRKNRYDTQNGAGMVAEAMNGNNDIESDQKNENMVDPINRSNSSHNNINNNNNNTKDKVDAAVSNAEDDSKSMESIVIPALRRINIRYKPKLEHELKFEPTLREPDFDNDKDIGMTDTEYEIMKKHNIFLHIQGVGSRSKTKIENWDVAVVAYEDYVRLPKPDNRGKYFVQLPNQYYQKDSHVHVRARVVYLYDSDVVVGGKVKDGDIVKKTEWADEKSTSFTGALDHQCVIPEIEEGIIPPASTEPAFGMSNYDSHNNNTGGSTPGAGAGAGAREAAVAIASNGKAANKKAKVKCDLMLIGAKKPKSKVFTFKDGALTYDALIQKATSAAKDTDDAFNYSFCLKEEPDVTISDNQDFLDHCVNSPADPKNHYNALIICTQEAKQ